MQYQGGQLNNGHFGGFSFGQIQSGQLHAGHVGQSGQYSVSNILENRVVV